jgi:hypothetical protein
VTDRAVEADLADLVAAASGAGAVDRRQAHDDGQGLFLPAHVIEDQRAGAGEPALALAAGHVGRDGQAVGAEPQAEQRVVDHRQVAGHRPQLAVRVDHRPRVRAVVDPRRAGDGLEVLHVRQVEGGAADQRGHRAIGDAVVIGGGGGAQPVRGDERPLGAVVIDRRELLLREDHRRRARAEVGIRRQHAIGLGRRGHAGHDRQRRAEQVPTPGRRRVEEGRREGRELAAGLVPEPGPDAGAQRVGPAGVAIARRGVAALVGERGGDLEGPQVQEVGRQRLAGGDRRRIGRGPVGVALLAPVEERLLAQVQPVDGVVHHAAIMLDGGAQRGERAIAKRGAIGGPEVR